MRAFACVLLSGCAILGDANAKHTSGGMACYPDRDLVATDLVIAAISGGILFGIGTLPDSPGWYALPGTFVASAGIGMLTTRSCRHRKPDERPSGTVREVPVRPPPPPEDPEHPACSIQPLVDCPAGWSCSLEDGNAGHCVQR